MFGLNIVLLALVQVALPKMTMDLLITLSGSLLSLLAYYVPVFRRWQEGLGEWTPLFMAGVLLVVDVAYMLVFYKGVLSDIAANWPDFLLIWFAALGSNFIAYKGIVKPAKEKAEQAKYFDYMNR